MLMKNSIYKFRYIDFKGDALDRFQGSEVHYVGFNGYHQCPENEKRLPKVITDWTCIKEISMPKMSTHRFILFETKDSFKICGNVTNDIEGVNIIKKPLHFSTFECCEKFLIASDGEDIWTRDFKGTDWIKLELLFLNEEDKSYWDKISKFSFQHNHSDVIISLSNGSVWVLLGKKKLKILYYGDIDKAVDISSGLEHSLILTESGCILSFGNGSRGQLGTGDLNPSLEPIQILDLGGLKISKIAAGGWHSCALTDSGDLYSWGWNNYGQLSAFEDEKEVTLTALPTLIDVGDDPDIKIVDVACGTRHTVAVLENGEIFSTGWNVYNQLGLNSQCEKIFKFTKTSLQRNSNEKLICGPWYTILVKESFKSEI